MPMIGGATVEIAISWTFQLHIFNYNPTSMIRLVGLTRVLCHTSVVRVLRTEYLS